ncbi:four helix bundle protein [Zavarzinella formosa]|uniref:four helix bundle protein n=1 Tax=Zavarzinella formosa TaxID=360055 RepID=UPI0019309AE1
MKPRYDLEERTAKFGECVISFCKSVPKNVITLPLIGQLVRSATSVGANYCEADESVSKKEFRQKIGYCTKEARETKHWLRMMEPPRIASKPKPVNCRRKPTPSIASLPPFGVDPAHSPSPHALLLSN